MGPVARAAEPYPLRFRIGERTLWSVRRRLVRLSFDLDAALAAPVPELSDDGAGADGFDLRSVPDAVAEALVAAHPRLIALVRQRYARRFIRFGGSFEAYLCQFSAKSRSTLKRKRARWIAAAGGLDLHEYHRPEDVGQFHRLAGPLSARTYQARLPGAGLPTGAAAEANMARRAAAGTMRAYILFHQGTPASYLYLPVERGRVIYAYLGYAPELAALSPGTVLQLEVLQRLFLEPGLQTFDFTEGDGEHKRLFATDEVACLDMLLLKPTLANRSLARALRAFDDAVDCASRTAARYGVKPALRRWLRRSPATSH